MARPGEVQKKTAERMANSSSSDINGSYTRMYDVRVMR